MSQTLIDALDALESQVSGLSAVVQANSTAKIGQQAEEGARRGAATAVAGLPEAARAMQEATATLKQALPAMQEAAGGTVGLKWWVRGVIALIVVVGLLSAFLAGAAYIRSGLAMTTETGCTYLGGQWGQRPTGEFICWRESQ